MRHSRARKFAPFLALAAGVTLIVLVATREPARPAPNPRPRWRASHGDLTRDGLVLYQDQRQETRSSFPLDGPVSAWASSVAEWLAANLAPGNVLVFVDADPQSSSASAALQLALEQLQPLPFTFTFDE